MTLTDHAYVFDDPSLAAMGSTRDLAGLNSRLDPSFYGVWFNRLKPFVDGVAIRRTPHLVLIAFHSPQLGDDGLRFATSLGRAGLSGPTSGDIERWNAEPKSDRRASEDGIKAWTRELVAMLKELTDPRNFADSQGYFDPVDRFHTTLDFVRFFRSTQATLASGPFSAVEQEAMLFDAIDTYQALVDRHVRVRTGKSQAKQWFVPSMLERRRQGLKRSMALGRDPIWGRLHLAIECLRAASEVGHWPQPGATNGPLDGRVLIGARKVSRDAALGEIVEIRRHAYTHSFTAALSLDHPDGARRRPILHAHDGYLPPQLSMAVLLFALDLVANPANAMTTKVMRRQTMLLRG